VTVRLLDSNIWIALARGSPGIAARVQAFDPSQIASCSIVRAELMFGARKSQRVAENIDGFQRLLAPFVSLPFDDVAAGHYGLVRATLERAGMPVGANDLLIASIALARNCLLVTRNSREFQRIVGLQVEVWPS
jgi:tRNA(fMet)-specific endonuclease VapC